MSDSGISSSAIIGAALIIGASIILANLHTFTALPAGGDVIVSNTLTGAAYHCGYRECWEYGTPKP